MSQSQSSQQTHTQVYHSSTLAAQDVIQNLSTAVSNLQNVIASTNSPPQPHQPRMSESLHSLFRNIPKD